MFNLVEDFRKFTNKKFIDFCLGFIKKNDAIIEIGPGDGLFADRLLEKIHPFSYEFVDIRDTRAFQKEREMQMADVCVDKIKKNNESIDVIIASQVIEHLKNITNFFLDVHRLLKKDGLLIIKFPNYSNLFNKITFLRSGIPRRLGGDIDNGGHINFIPYKYLTFFLKDYFELREIKGDLFVDPIFTRKLLTLVNKRLYLINTSISSLNFSWNVMICLRKK